MAKKKQDLINGTFREKKRNLKKIMAFGDGRISGKTLENMKACGSFMEFIATVDKEKKKMVHGMFCKNRFCPVCGFCCKVLNLLSNKVE